MKDGMVAMSAGGAASLRGTVGVITVTYNSSDDLAAFLESVRPEGLDPAMVLVVDNASDDQERSEEVSAAFGARFLRMDRNVGYGAAVNRGVAQLPPEIDRVLVANPDVRVHPGALAVLASGLGSDGPVGAVGPVIENPDGTIYPSARSLPSLRNGIGHALFSRTWPDNPWSRQYRHVQEGLPTRRPAGWLSGACVMVRRDAFESIGGFDEGYFMYFEDVDLGRRLAAAGWSNVLEPAARVTHVGATSTARVAGPMLQAHHRSAYRYLSAVYSGPVWAPVRLGLWIGLGVRSRVLSWRSGRRSSSIS